MNTIGERLKELRKKEKLTQQQLADKLGCSHQSISCYENNRHISKIQDFIEICKYFDKDMYYLITGLKNNKGSEITLQEQQIISAYNNLIPNSDKQKIVNFIMGIGEYDTEPNPIGTEPQKIYRFPVYDQQAAAGAGITGRDGKFTMQNIFTDDIPKNAVFGVHIKGNSMINTDEKLIIEDIPDDSIVLLNPKVSNSDLNKTIVVASINNEVICKYFLVEQDCIHFYSLNRNEHEDDDRFAKSPKEYRIIGQVVKVIKPNEYE